MIRKIVAFAVIAIVALAVLKLALGLLGVVIGLAISLLVLAAMGYDLGLAGLPNGAELWGPWQPSNSHPHRRSDVSLASSP